ncbi:Replication termination protein [Alkalihalobacillus sp. FSL W8-0930]
MNSKRVSTGFLIKQRLFLKAYLISFIEDGRPYGTQMLEELKEQYKPYGFSPNHAELYRALYELIEEGVLRSTKRKLREDSFQEVNVYYFRDSAKAHRIKQEALDEMVRSHAILEKAINDLRVETE